MESKTYPVYYQPYIAKVPEGDPLVLLELGLKETLKTFAMVPEEKGSWAYAEGKWSLKDLLQHLIDTERIICYRALSFARGESTKIPGYDHNEYVAQAKANQRSIKELLEELKRLRASTIDLFRSFDEEQLNSSGNANGIEFKVEQFLYIILGHEIHHLEVIQERYLNA